jgi:hypothetical protein
MAEPLVWWVLGGAALLSVVLLLWWRGGSSLGFEVTVDHPTFYPNRRTAQRLLVIRMRLSQPATVEIDLYDEFNRHVMKLGRGRQQGAGEHFRLWNGRDELGTRLPGGSYLIQGTARRRTSVVTSSVWVRLDPSEGVEPRKIMPPQGFEEWVDEGQIVEESTVPVQF